MNLYNRWKSFELRTLFIHTNELIEEKFFEKFHTIIKNRQTSAMNKESE